MLLGLIGFCGHNHKACIFTARDKAFGAIEDVVVAIPFSQGRLADGVLTGVGFGQGKSADVIPPGKGLQIMLLLFFGAMAKNALTNDGIVNRHDDCGGCTGVGNF